MNFRKRMQILAAATLLLGALAPALATQSSSTGAQPQLSIPGAPPVTAPPDSVFEKMRGEPIGKISCNLIASARISRSNTASDKGYSVNFRPWDRRSSDDEVPPHRWPALRRLQPPLDCRGVPGSAAAGRQAVRSACCGWRPLLPVRHHPDGRSESLLQPRLSHDLEAGADAGSSWL